MSSRLRLLLDSVPLSRVPGSVLAAQEDQVLAWQLDIGSELAAENVPLTHVVLVVEGTLRVSGSDALGQPFTIRRIHAGEWWGLWSGLSGVSVATCRTTETTKVLAVPIKVWQDWWEETPALVEWVESHPQREDLYSALRPLLAERPRQDRTFLDEIDHLQVVLRTIQLRESEALKTLNSDHSGIGWLVPSIAQLLPDFEPFGAEGLASSTIEAALHRSPYGLRLVGYPIAALQELFDGPADSSPLAPDSPNDGLPQEQDGLIEALPDWQNPDGEALLAAALRQEQGRPSRDDKGLLVKPIFGHSGIEQGLALLQMICETLRLPFRRDVVDRMLKATVGNKPAPTLEHLGQIADGLGLSAVLMKLPPAHLGRLSLPAVLELPEAEGIVLVTGSARSRLRVIDPREGERWIAFAELEQEQQSCRAITFSRRPNTATKRFDITYFFPFLQRYRRSLVLVFVASLFIQIFSLAQPLIIQQIIDKVIGYKILTPFISWVFC